MTNRNRVMLIVWWWKYGGLEEAWDEWTVAGYPEGHKLIRMDEPRSAAGTALIRSCVEDHLENSDVFIFLHRNHGYNQQAIEEILSGLSDHQRHISQLKCFLFGEGNDDLYIAKQPRALLGTKGTFRANMHLPNHHGNLIDAVANPATHQLKREHFDFVWKVYSHAFKAKVFELKEDLLTAFVDFSNMDLIPSGELYRYIRLPENRLLFLRLLSFTGRMRKGSDLERELIQWESREKRSLFFDDFSTNLKTTYGELEGRIYKNLVEAIKTHIFSVQGEADLPSIRGQFESLLSVMSEATYI
ncbi:MAG: hypothetical protein DHS20C18_30670 [Saprospiraceae bacterium]|nr:MAG: hypothetical protein DHS20C18_30670 [Saprospiraceae bacterium]